MRSCTGIILGADRHRLVLQSGTDEIRLELTPDTRVWYGGRTGLEALRPGREAIVRPRDDGPGVDRIWVDITRVTGTILSRGQDAIEVDAGPHRAHTQVLLPRQALERVLVRHPQLEPGHLIDVIGTRSPDGTLAARPGTAQPWHPAATVQAAGPLHGTATWSDLGHRRGAAYPAVDPEGDSGGCPDARAGCVALPYLSLGHDLIVRNSCTERAAAVPVVQCGCVAARFCDRCVECGTSPRGRLVELSPADYADLGGDLDTGCFNVTLEVSR
ncbi:hypothetical protein DPM19_12390 [Actinomadura craniellae]|uniref:Uncharacterized protein n=1 Tax=Actinomadura craniellae TaxID=2231787 RepID=A0A365H734_9ACTN|nr:hypothetical protein DPM19_12390 [Actinomadura craniellae]